MSRQPMDHGYPVVITWLPPEEGGGYVAYIPQLGSSAFNGCGGTPLEALQSLEECYAHVRPLIENEKGYEFPRPIDWQRLQYMIPKEEMLRSTTEPILPVICPDEKKLAEIQGAYQFLRFRLRTLKGVARVENEAIDLGYRAKVYLKPGDTDNRAEYSVYDLEAEFHAKYEGLRLDITVLEDTDERHTG